MTLPALSATSDPQGTSLSAPLLRALRELRQAKGLGWPPRAHGVRRGALACLGGLEAPERTWHVHGRGLAHDFSARAVAT